MFHLGSICQSFKRSVAVRGCVFGPEIFRFCSSKAVQYAYSVRVLKLWADLHKFEELGRGSFERSWLREGVRAAVFALEIFRFCRSWADGSSSGFCFLNWWPNLHKNEGGGHVSKACGRAWRHVLAPVTLIFQGFVN